MGSVKSLPVVAPTKEAIIPYIRPYSAVRASVLSSDGCSPIHGKLCNFCHDLLKNLLSKWASKNSSRWSNPPLWDSRPRGGRFSMERHHTTVTELEKSANSCALCELIRQSISSSVLNLPSYSIETYAKFPHAFVLFQGNRDSHNRYEMDLQFRLHQTNCFRGDLSTVPKMFWNESPQWPNYDLEIALTELPFDDEAFLKIRKWSADCANHFLCSKTRGPSNLPKRVLDLSEFPSQTSLYISNGEDAPYATLSYCWGSGLALKTTKSNIKKHCTGIPLELFPKTLKDAIIIAQRLEFRYIWIDALCIVQDDPLDWSEQAAKMAAIYRGGQLNISIGDSPSCESGVLATPNEALKISESPDHSKDLFIVAGPVCQSLMDTGSFLIDSRGWTFQEHLVSAASLIVSRRGVFWDCCSGQRAMNGTNIYTAAVDSVHGSLTLKRSWAETCDLSRAIKSKSDNPSSDSEIARPPLGSSGLNGIESLARTWYDWTNQFSARSLTVEGDRLPAVAGLASFLATTSGLTYVAGLWKEDLVVGLTWMAKGPALQRRSSKAPSWSWASVSCPVTYNYVFSMGIRHKGLVLDSKSLNLQILNVVVEEVYAESYGAVDSARITAVGLIQEVEMFEPAARLPNIFDIKSVLTGQYPVKYTLDEALDRGAENLKTTFWLLRLTTARREKASYDRCVYMFFLILEKINGPENTFRRLGCGYVDRTDDGYSGRVGDGSDIFKFGQRITLALV
jgi:hypothetical protein